MLDLCCAYVGPCWAPAGRAGAILSQINYVGPMLGQERRVHLGPCTRAQMNMQLLAHVGVSCWARSQPFRGNLGLVGGLKNSQRKKQKAVLLLGFVGVLLGGYTGPFWAVWGAMLGLCVTHVGLMLVHVAPLGAMLGPS